MLALALGCLGAVAVGAQHVAPGRPPERPVVTLDGLPGSLAVLSGTPQRPAPLPSMPVTRIDDRGRTAELDAPRPLSLTFARPLPVRDVLLLLFRGTPFSLVLEPRVSGTFAGELKDLTLRQALESVLRPVSLDYDAQSTVVRVFPRKPETRWFAVDHLYAPRVGMDYFAELGAAVRALLSGGGKYHVDRKASLIQVTDFADRLDLVAAYLEASQIRTNRQVRVHARIFEVTRADGTPIDWGALAARPDSGIRRIAGTAGWRVDDAGAWRRSIEALGAVRHVASPALLAMNNEPGMLRAEDSETPLDLRLTLTPQVAADGTIHMQVAPVYSDGRTVMTAAGETGTRFTASVDTAVRIADGDTVLIGGLLRRQGAASHAEVVILLTATVVTPAGLAAAGGRDQ